MTRLAIAIAIAIAIAFGFLAGHVITTASANVAHWHIHGGSYD